MHTTLVAQIFSRLVVPLAVLMATAGCGVQDTAGQQPSNTVSAASRSPASSATATKSPGTTSATPSSNHRSPPPSPSPEKPRSAAAGTALAALTGLTVKGRAPITGYDRDRFGSAWLDADHNGCDTRDDILARDLNHLTYERGTHHCVVATGDLADPYTATTIDFVKGDGTLVDIDHVVALGNAWVTGAFGWDIHKRAALSNDSMNLLSVDASANRQKGDGDAATWLPANKRFRCSYVARQIGVKAKYDLWVKPPEKHAMSQVLAGCPNQPATPDSGAPTRVTNNITDPGVPGTGSVRHTPPPSSQAGGYSGGTDPRFDYCYQAQDKGCGPYYKGKDPEYSWYTDADGDGVVCE